MSGCSCGSCGAGIVHDNHAENPHAGRGLCKPCHGKALRGGTLADHPRGTWSRDELMTEWDLLRSEGHTRVQAAERLGMKPAAFERALQRARAAGDPRAVPGVAGGMSRAKAVVSAEWIPAHQFGDAHAMAR